MIDQNYIEKQNRIEKEKYIAMIRKENKNNPNYPVVFWNGSETLYVKIGAYENKKISVEEAIDIFKDNKQFMDELDLLLESRKEYDETYGIIEKPEPGMSDKQTSIKTNVDVKLVQLEIESKIADIIIELGLEKSDDVMIQLKNCCLVQKYIVENNSYDDKVMEEKEAYNSEDIAILDLYNAVVLHKGVCTSNSLMFKKILKQLGLNVEVIGLHSTKGGMHAANIVKLDGEYYFFDTTLEATIYEQNSHHRNGNLILCCAGLGKNEYCQFYTPKVVLPDNPTDNVKPVPENISEYRIPSDIVNNLIIKPSEHNIKH